MSASIHVIAKANSTKTVMKETPGDSRKTKKKETVTGETTKILYKSLRERIIQLRYADYYEHLNITFGENEY